MGKPVVQLVVGQLLLLGPVGPHPPDLHGAAANGVEVDVCAIRRVLRSVVESRGIGQADLRATLHRNFVDVVITPTLRGIGKITVVVRPSVQVRRPLVRDLLRRPTLYGHRINDGLAVVLFGVMADREHRPVERNYMVVIVAGSEVRVDDLRLPRCEIESVEQSVVVVDECLAVGRPIRRLQRFGDPIQDLPMAGVDIHNLEITADVILIRHVAFGRRDHHAHVGESSLLEHVFVVRRNEQSDVDVVRQIHPGKLGPFKLFTKTCDGHDVPAARPLELDHVGCGRRRLHLLGLAPLRAAELQGRETVPVHGDINVRRLRVQARSDDPSEFSVRIHSLAQESRVRAKYEIAGQSFPDEIKFIGIEPHIGARSLHDVLLAFGVEQNRSRNIGGSDIRIAVEESDFRLCLGGPRQQQHESEEQRETRKSSHPFLQKWLYSPGSGSA